MAAFLTTRWMLRGMIIPRIPIVTRENRTLAAVKGWPVKSGTRETTIPWKATIFISTGKRLEPKENRTDNSTRDKMVSTDCIISQTPG
jgi:hypothetical protein